MSALPLRWAFAVALGATLRSAPVPDWGQPKYVCSVLDSFGMDQGFTKANVLAAAQTRDGYMWIGTGSGLARFDGLRFVSYRGSNTPELASNTINCLCEDTAGSLWIGTERGLVRHRNGVFLPPLLPGVAIKALTSDPDGDVWIGTNGRGLFREHAGDCLDANPPGGLPAATISSLLVDSGDRLWIGFVRGGGLVWRTDAGFARYDAGGRLTDQVDALCESPSGTVWIGTHARGLFCWHDGQLEGMAPPPGSAPAPVSDIKVREAGGIWVAAGDVEVLAPDDHALHAVPGLPTRDVLRLWEDNEQGLWVCAKEEGLFRAPPNPYVVLLPQPSAHSRRLRTVSADPRGNLWLTEEHGLAELLPNGSLVEHGPGDGFAGPPPRSVFAAADGSIWLAGAVLQRRVAGRVESFPEIQQPYGVYVDHTGAVWAGTASDGLYRRQGGQWARIASGAGTPFRFATSFAEGPDGTLYAGSWQYGLLAWNAGRADWFDHRNGLPSDEVRAVFVDRDGILWAGFADRGLAARIDGRWWNPSELSENLADHVCAIQADGRDRLWLGTSVGIYFVSRSELVAAARGRGPLPRLRLATIGDEAHRPSVWSGAQPTAWPLADGRILFATRAGIIAVDPARFDGDSAPPQVRIESVLVDQRPAAAGEDLRVPAGAHRLDFGFAAPAFNRPREIRYRYRLEGYDAGWVDAGAARAAQYAPLPPGNYRLRVTAVNGDGRAGAAATLPITVAPTFLQRLPVRLVGLALFTLLVVGVVRYLSFRRLHARLAELERRAALEKERARIARDIHDDVGNRLTEIILLSQLALRRQAAPGEREEHLRQIGASAREVTDSLDEIVWAISPRRDTLPHLISYVGEFAVEFLRAGGIGCQLELPESLPDRPVPAEMRHNVFLAVKEALNNVVRHAGADQVRLKVEVTADRAVIAIRDNGRGLPADPARTGADGLRNMSQRMDEIRGRFAIASEAGGGTEVRLEFVCPTPP